MRRQRSHSRSANQAPQFNISPNSRMRQNNYAALSTSQATTAGKVPQTRLLRPSHNPEEQPELPAEGPRHSVQQCPLSQMTHHLTGL